MDNRWILGDKNTNTEGIDTTKKYLFISDNGGDHNSKTRCYIFAGDVFKKYSKRFE
jgi:hypothetical protein